MWLPNPLKQVLFDSDLKMLRGLIKLKLVDDMDLKTASTSVCACSSSSIVSCDGRWHKSIISLIEYQMKQSDKELTATTFCRMYLSESLVDCRMDEWV